MDTFGHIPRDEPRMTGQNTTSRWMLKIVPDAEPNAEGEWIDADVPCQFEGQALWDFIPRPGYHVVQSRAPRYPREGNY